jgi:hypothetical protein
VATSDGAPFGSAAPGFRNARGPLLYGQGPVSETLRRLEACLDSSHIPHILIGRVATNAYGHARMTDDVDVCVRADDLPSCWETLAANGYAGVPGRGRRFLDPQTGVTIDIIVSGKAVGRRREQRAITFPDPAEAETHAGIPVPSLARLIELKLALWRFKDWGDVVELIRELDLSPSFAEQLEPSVRPLYADCCEHRLEEDRCDREMDSRDRANRHRTCSRGSQ